MAGTDVFEGVPAELVERFHLDRLPLDRPGTATAELLRLDGKRALVTGGGGDGLGNATCHRLAEQGASVAVVDVDAGAAALAASEVASRWGVETLPLVAHVGEWDQIRDAVQTAAAHFGGIDILVNNAGGAMRGGTLFADAEIDDIRAVVDLNLFGVLYTTKAVLEVMLPARSGRIVNVASEGGKIGLERITVYNSCKAGVIGFTRNLAHEVGRHGVTTVAVCPGIMIAGRTVSALRGPVTGRLDELNDGFARTTIGRCSIPDEVASMIAFAASPAGSYLHGTAVSVGGGMAD
jgi:3-oxoacyl-[acyl-carrier protein] reductase